MRPPTGDLRWMPVLRAGVVDIGSNSIRLLVADVADGSVHARGKDGIRLGLGEEIERTGAVSGTSIAAAAKTVRLLCEEARNNDVAALDVFLTAPGRQSANADELVAALSLAADQPVRVLSIEEEGRLAFAGALATAGVELHGAVGVCDIGGASTEIAVGPAGRTPDWVDSVELGAARLSARTRDLDEMRREVEEGFAAMQPPRIDVGLVVGGSARATRRLVGPWLDDAELSEALALATTATPRQLSRRFGVGRSRARLVPAGVVVLAHVRELLGVPLHVCRGGLREGAVLAAQAA